MKTSTKIIAATLTAVTLAVAGVAVADPHYGPGYGMGYGMGAHMGGAFAGGPWAGHMGGAFAGGPRGGHMGGYGYGGGPWGGGPMGFGAQGPDIAAAVTAGLTELKATLKIAPAQEAAWQSYETAVRQQAETMQAYRSAMHAPPGDPKAAPVDYAALRESMWKLHEANFAARAELFAALTPEQKAVAGARLSRGFGFGGPMAFQRPAK